jgi:hypothetical protein
VPLIAAMFCAEYLYRQRQHAGRTPDVCWTWSGSFARSGRRPLLKIDIGTENEYPLLRASPPGSTFASRDGAPITVETFLNDFVSLAAVLPSRRHVVNLCRDRSRPTTNSAAEASVSETLPVLAWRVSISMEVDFCACDPRRA